MKLIKILAGEWKSGNDIALLLIRIIFAIILIHGHGWGKVVKAFSGDEIQFMDPIGLGESISFYLVVFAEFVCAIFLILGLFTRLAALVLIINFAVIFHLKWVINQSPIGDIEHIVFYFFIFIALFISGAGKFSLDKVLYSKNK